MCAKPLSRDCWQSLPKKMKKSPKEFQKTDDLHSKMVYAIRSVV